MPAYYNEIDPFAAEWLRELIKAGHIAPGEVDTRSIEDVVQADLRGFTQCHFFAGIGVWSYALRLAGWPDDRPVWTGSCPCQPFSAAGKGNGFADERHLWPAFHHLIRVCRPPVVFGEQVASKNGLTWLDLVHADMEGEGYSCGAVDTCSAGFGAPHIRQRLYWVADTAGSGRREEQQNHRRSDAGNGAGQTGMPAGVSRACRVANMLGQGLERQGCPERGDLGEDGHTSTLCTAHGLADSNNAGRQLFKSGEPAGIRGEETIQKWRVFKSGADGASFCARHPCPTNGFWGAADWLLCRDGKWRPVEPGTFPLVDGAPARVGRLRGYGNAINAVQAKEFIKAYMATTLEGETA